jgi:hypothetical protein
MKRVRGLMALCLLVCFVGVGGSALPAGAGAAADANAYFDALVARPDHFKSFSLRDTAQVLNLRAADSNPASITYDPEHDTYAQRQDAAKVVIPPFSDVETLSSGISPSQTTITLHDSKSLSLYVKRRQVRIDKEIMTITARATNVITVQRGVLGTSAASHAAGATVSLSTNSIANQMWLPVGTQDGHTYLATWDAWYGSELRRDVSGLKNWKTFQFDARKKAGGSAGIWFEVRTRFDLAPTPDDVAMVDARGYSIPFGPNVTRDQPLTPQAGTFVVKPETWVRYWVLIEQHSDSWDLMSLWVADETHDPVQIINRLQFENYGLIDKFRFEFNTSTYAMTVNRGDLVAYVKNWVMLQDPKDPTSVMQRPFAGLPLPPKTTAPSAPKNLRVVPSTH